MTGNSVRNLSKISHLFDDFGAMGAPSADLSKKLGNVSNIRWKIDLGVHFRPLSPKSGHLKIDCFSDPAFSTKNRARGAQSRHHGRSGVRKAPKMDPKMMTFRGPAEKCEFEPLSYENLFFAVQRGPRIAPIFLFFRKALLEAYF